jgi:hypothetical protein
MDVARGEKFLATRLEPTVASVGLALWAVPISAAVVRDGAMSTAGARIDMTAEGGGATAYDGQQDFEMRPVNPSATAPDESNSRGADEIGQLQERPIHLFLRL